MATVASVKQTGGGGFHFEDLVGAYFAAAILAGEDPSLDLPVARRIDFQVAQGLWALDDLLYEFADGTKVPTSIKSGQQFPQGRAPQDFVRDAWSEVLGLSGSPFDPARDLLGLIAPRAGVDTERQLADLIGWANSTGPEEIEQRLRTPGAASDGHRVLWKSFECPPDLAERSENETSVSALLRRLRFSGLDLLTPSSVARSGAVGWCKSALLDPARARELWERLTVIVSERRPLGGAIDWPTLREQLAGFELQGAIDYEPDRQALDRLSRQNQERISARIASRVTIARTAEIAKLAAAQEAAATVALVGPSGCGKTVVAKQWTEANPDNCVIWLRADQPELLGGSSSPLAHDFEDVLNAAPSQTTLVIDGLDRRFDEGSFHALARLLDLARAGTGMKVVLTCQEQEWGRVSEGLRLANAGAAWEIVSISPFSVAEVDEVLSQMPPLRAMAAKSDLAGVLSRPKVLDAIASRLYEQPDSREGELGGDESAVANWFWEYGLGTGSDRHARAKFLLDLGEMLADNFEPSASLQATDADVLDGLVRDGLCEVDAGRVSFGHDLYGDWARYQLLLAQGPELSAYLGERIDSPIWHRSVRLYALGQLADGGGAAWGEQLRRLGPDSRGLVRDLFLDAPIFAADASTAIESVWPVLIDNEGALLSRFLSRFLHTATVPNPYLMAAFQAAQADVAVYAAANNRIPFAPLWPAVLAALSRHKEEAVSLADIEVAQVVDLWLRHTPKETPFRDECAELALAAAKVMLEQSATLHVYVAKEIQSHHLRAALAAIGERPQQVEELVRLFIEPQSPADEHDDRLRSAESIAAEETVDFDPFEDGDSYAWLGAGTREGFRGLCLDTDALYPMFTAAPGLAAELLTAILVPPRPDRQRRAGSLTRGFGVYDDMRWSSAMWIRGPYLRFLNTNPEVGIRLVVGLANAATERYLEGREAELPGEGPEPSTEIPLDSGLATWVGDGQVFVWYTGDSRCPNTISSALMALEKWLYDRIDQGQGIEAELNQILAESESVALAGLLLAIGYRQPELFKGPLRPLLGASTLYHWEHARIIQGTFQHQIGLFLEPEPIRGIISQWHEMTHRSIALESVAQTLLLTDAGVDEFMQGVRARWGEVGAEQDRHLAARLDRANWSLHEAEDGTQRWEYEHPPELRKESEEFAEEAIERHFWLQMPHRMRQAIDDPPEADIDDEELRSFWENTVARAQRPFPTDLGEDGVLDPLDLRCGIAAFLVIRQRAWLQRNSEEEEEWCRAILLEGALKKSEQKWFDADDVANASGYQSFCAQALPILWAEAPNDPALREGIAVLAANRHFDVIARLYSSAAERRSELGASFEELQALSVSVARFRTRRRIVTYSDDEQAARENFASLEEALNAFHDGKLEREIVDFSLNAALPPSAPSRQGRKRKARARQPAIDLHHIWSAWLWMPPFSQARDSTEHEEWLLFWKRMISAVVQRSEVGDDEDAEVSGPRFEYESVLLTALPTRVLELDDPTEAEGLWKPLLARGAAGHSWIDAFLNSWVRTGLALDDSSGRFAERWEAMLRFAEAAWQQRSYDAASNWRALLAMGAWLSEAGWGERHALLFARLQPFYERWADPGLDDPQAVTQFTRLLCRAGTEPLTDSGLIWLERAAPTGVGATSWDRIDDDLVSLLSTLAARRPDLPRASSPSGKAFRQLLNRAVERHDRVALALQEQLFGGSSGHAND